MKSFVKVCLGAVVVASLVVPLATGVEDAGAKPPSFLVTDDDGTPNNTATVYQLGGTASNPRLTTLKSISTGGSGAQNHYVLAHKVVASKSCIYVSDAGSNDVAGIAVSTQKVVGNFKGSAGDQGGTAIGLALNSTYL